MFSKTKITKSTQSYSDNIEKLKKALAEADAVVISDPAAGQQA